jgi:hypothetical protein
MTKPKVTYEVWETQYFADYPRAIRDMYPYELVRVCEGDSEPIALLKTRTQALWLREQYENDKL